MARQKRKKRRSRSRSENIMLIVGILAALSMVFGSLVALFG
jgi:NADH:ubiquinone oxidoreductase subunit 2 (subunit N)